MVVFQLGLLALVSILDFGLLGRSSIDYFDPSLGLIAVWAFTWFGAERDAFRFALLLGIVFDLVSFLPIGTWVVCFLGAHLLTDFLRRRFFEAASLLLALAAVAIVSIWFSAVIFAVTRSFDVVTLAGGVIANCTVSAVLYYFVGIRFRFLQRWAGRRL